MSQMHCFHCSLPVPEPVIFYAEVSGQQHPVCCPGCKAVTEAIIEGGLGNYYQHRTEPAPRADNFSQKLKDEMAVYDRPDIQTDFVTGNENLLQGSLLIEGITCAACVWLLEKHLGSLTGVTDINVNLSTHEAFIQWDPELTELSTLLLEIYRIGYRAFPWRADQQEAMLKNENRVFIRRLAVAGIGAMQVMMYAIALYSGAISNDMAIMYRDFIRIVSALVATPVILYSAAPFFRAASRDLKIRKLSMDVPVSLAIGGAYIASLWATYTGRGEIYFDSATMFTFFLLTGRYLELKARHATVRSARSLTNLVPPSCLKKTGEHFQRVPTIDLAVSDIIRILPGDVIPADGDIIKGCSSVNESMLTGEYMPVSKTPGDTVLCGSLNTDNAIEIQVSHVGQQTRMAGIILLLQKTQQDKPPVALLADKVAQWFIACILLTSVAVYWIWSGIRPEDAFWITLSVLVVTCPCALSLATPAALTAATGHLHKLGLLVTKGHILEGLNKTTHVVFDKTGTLTRGELTLAETIPIASEKIEAPTIAAALEAHSEHPIAKAFTANSQKTATEVLNFAGNGLEGMVEGTRYRIGRPAFALPENTPAPPEPSGQWLLLASQQQPLCWFRISDSLRPEATEIIVRLKKLGKKITLLSGDTEPVVATTATKVGINFWQSEASPDQKLSFIKKAQKKGDKILMIGDGINDVPVLAGADFSLAMGNASDLARTSADAVLISSDLNQLLAAFEVARKTRAIIRQNLGWALTYNLTALPMAAMGLVAPWMAAIGMALSSLIVVGNSLRLNPKEKEYLSGVTSTEAPSPVSTQGL